MVKGVAVKFKSYEETIPQLLKLIKFDEELKKHERIVLKPNLMDGNRETSTKAEFVNQVLRFCMENKNPGTEILIAEGCDGHDTMEVFDELGYTTLASKYGIGLIDLNDADTEEKEDPGFLGFESIHYPRILDDSFIISLPKLMEHEEIGMRASLDNMLGAYPLRHYKGFFASNKSKLKKHPVKYQIHDIVKCKLPEFTIIDASDRGLIITGRPLDMDKQAAKALGLNWQEIQHLRLIDETLSAPKNEEAEVEELIGS